MREQLIADKKSQIQAELEQWAKDFAILSPGEQIRFSLRIVTVPLVLEDKEDILKMPVQEFFTRTRFLEAGVARTQATYVSGQLIEALRTDVSLSDPFEKKSIATVGEFVQYLSRIYYLPNLGDRRKMTKSWQYIYKVLRDTGFELKE